MIALTSSGLDPSTPDGEGRSAAGGHHQLAAAGPVRLRDGTLELLTVTGVARLPPDDVRGAVLAPVLAVDGAPTLLALCQDRPGRPSTARSFHALGP